jgi:hypothetical protein
MDIYPSDIGPAEREEIRRYRQLFPADFSTNRSRASHSVGVHVSLVALLALTAIARFVYHSEIWLTSGAGGLIFVAWYLQDRLRRRPEAVEAPLLASDVQIALQVCKEPLRRSYLELVILAVGTDEIGDAEAERSVREAIQALGVSIGQIPAADPHEAADDPQELLQESLRLRAAAGAEADEVVASSLRRRAEAVSRQAEIAGRTATLLRRNEALRQEIAVQINALRTSLTAFRVGGQQSAGELTDVAASIQNVAREACAITQAREEMDHLLAGVPTGPEQA